MIAHASHFRISTMPKNEADMILPLDIIPKSPVSGGWACLLRHEEFCFHRTVGPVVARFFFRRGPDNELEWRGALGQGRDETLGGRRPSKVHERRQVRFLWFNCFMLSFRERPRSTSHARRRLELNHLNATILWGRFCTQPVQFLSLVCRVVYGTFANSTHPFSQPVIVPTLVF